MFLSAVLIFFAAPAAPGVLAVVGGPMAFAEGMPDSDGDGITDHEDPCPHDASNQCFSSCMTSHMQPTFFQGLACVGLAAGIVGGTVATVGGISAIGSALAASWGISNMTWLTNMIVAGAAGVSWAILSTLCACLFHVFG